MLAAPALFLLLAALASLAATVTMPGALFPALAACCFWSVLMLPASVRPISPNFPLSVPRATRLRRFARFLQRNIPAALRLALAALTLVSAGLALARLFPGSLPFLAGLIPDATAAPASTVAVPLLALFAFAGFFLQTYAGLRAASPGSGALPWPPLLSAALLRAATTVFAVLAALFVAESRLGFAVARPAAVALMLILVAWLAESALRAAARAYQPFRYARLLPPLGLAWPLVPFLPTAARNAFLRPPVSDAPTLALADLWFLPTLRRLLFPLFASAALLLWLASIFHEVPHGNLGIETRLGRAQAAPLEPGLHFTLPAPFAAVKIIATERLQSVVLGAAGDFGKPILWEREHYVDEEARLVGGGQELLTISVPIFFHIRDPLAYTRNTTDAARLVRDLADQILQAETTRLPAFVIMTSDRERLAAHLHARLQIELDRRNTGLAIALVCLRDIHPPVAVGPAYQDVVSALEDRETYRHEGERLRADTLPRFAAEAAKLRTGADTLLTTRISQATGRAHRFTAQLAAYQDNPEIFRLRSAYASYDDGMRTAKKLVLAEAFHGHLPATLDVRRTLNPDFAPPLTPITPQLIPSPFPAARTDAFDLAIEGYLKAGLGAIPAVDLKPVNSDHLIDPTAGEARR